MPIVEIRGLPPKDPGRIPAMLREAAVAGARAFNIPETKVWATYEEIRSGWMAEGNTCADHPGIETHPPLVLIRALPGRTPEMIETFMRGVCEAISKGLEIPATNIWCQYVLMEKNQIWHNGKFLSS